MNTIAIACALVMAGTGDLKLLTKLRKLQTRIAMDVSYGDHMMIHMAIGLVCLGSGKMSVNNSNRSVAVLLCAFYPSFPSLVTDNRSHLQALRHLWVLSAEWRSLIVKDTESFESLQVPIEISLKDGSRIRRITPCILPPFDSIKSVILKSSKHLPARIESDQLPKQDFAWIVQRRAGCAKENEAGIAENPFSSSSLQCLEPVDVPIYDDEIIGFVDQQFPFQLLQFL
jgi:anaphase-promoting complex subunit 1